MGAGLSQLTDAQVSQLKKDTNFDERTLAKILKRYSDFDQSEKGANGLTLSNVLAIPEFVGFALVTYVAKIYMNKDNEKMFPQDFIYFISALSSKSSIEFKQDLAFKIFDHGNKGELSYEEVYRMYSIIFDGAMSQDQLLDLTHRALTQPQLHTQNFISREEFNSLVPSWEIQDRLTVDLQNIF